jgi:glycosyltransferase involved in cell wall biosynthesis
MTDLDLVIVDGDSQRGPWAHGRQWHVKRTPAAIAELVQSSEFSRNSGAVLFWSPRAGEFPRQATLEQLVRHRSQVLHGGLKLGLGGQPSFVDYVAPIWMLNRDPSPNIAATSWRLSLDAALIEKKVLLGLGGFDSGYDSVEGMGLDFGYRCITRGVVICHAPSLVEAAKPREPISIPIQDHVRFVLSGWGKAWAGWACFRAVATRHPGARGALLAMLASLRSQGPFPVAGTWTPRKGAERSINMQNEKVSVLLPTLGRYPYLRKALSDLSKQSIKPHEVIVVDGNSDQETDWIESFKSAPLRVLSQKRSGQCTARNAGIAAASGDWILFIDDDDELPDDLIAKHLDWASSTEADVSCGVVDEVGAVDRGPAYRIHRISDGFPTNNMLARLDSVNRAGRFDERLDRGEREDHDLGMRVYLQGDLLMQNPGIAVIHHHAPVGGLRSYGSRISTYGASRKHLLVRRLPTPSDIYIGRKYHSARQLIESKWLALLGTFRLHGPWWRKIVKALLGLVLLPDSIIRIRRAEKGAAAMASQPLSRV